MIPPQQQPDVAGAVLALDQAMIALAVAKSVLLGETIPAIDLAAAERDPANPYGSTPMASLRDREHYDAEVAEDTEPCVDCGSLLAYSHAEYCSWWQQPGQRGSIAPFPHEPHLPQHTGGNPVCGLCGIDHDAAARLAPPVGYQLHSISIPGDSA